ncbi:hypothetical protein EI613_31525 (plasmid) [Azospirillum sp. 412522]|nr:hypothetical protein [Azospirillum sp. 412522]MBY6266395.1 hypothetical protein [Azospirillum sp. 412522]
MITAAAFESMVDFVIINSQELLADLAEILRHGLERLGHRCTIRSPRGLRLDPAAIHILFDSTALDVAALPANVVVFNHEQFGSGSTLLTPAYLASLRGRIVWDYSIRNLLWMRDHGVNPHLAAWVRLGSCPALLRALPQAEEGELYDVLFYGTVNRRRLDVLRGLVAAGLKVAVLTGGFAADVPAGADTDGLSIAPPAFGERLDGWIARARVVLNMHFYDTRIVEIVRLAPLLANGRAVVAEVDPDSEIDDDLRDAVAAAPYEALVERCLQLVADGEERRRLGQRAAARFAARDAADGLRPAVEATLKALAPRLASRQAPATLPAAPVAAPKPRMRLAACLVACDDNPLYLDFLPLVHKVWTELVGVRVKIVLIADAIPDSCRPWADDIVLFPPLPGVSTAFQAQCIRLLYPALMEPDCDGGAVVISDMDMIPMSRRYFADSIAGLPDDHFAVYRGNVLIHDSAQIAICYNAARPAVWAEVVGGSAGGGLRDMDDVRRILAGWAARCPEYDGTHGGQGWSFDQQALFSLVGHWARQGTNRERLTVLSDAQTGFDRLDRLDLMRAGGLSALQGERVRAHLYADCHLLRPQSVHGAFNAHIAGLLSGRGGSGRTRLISMSVWGDQPMYWEGVLENARIAPVIYPGWRLRIYTDTENAFTREAERLGAEIRVMRNRGGIHGMFWRFLPAAEPDVEAVIVRDADSRLNLREAAAVAEWLASGRGTHVMRDHPHHLAWPMLGGMWGIRGGTIPDMAERIDRWGRWDKKLDDMYFLAEVVWPMVKDHCLQHCRGSSPWGGVPFPQHPPCGCDYVGQVYNAGGVRDSSR